MEYNPQLINHFLEHSASMFPDKCALVDGANRATYNEINRESNRLAAWLRVQRIEKGDRVVIMLRNSLEYVVSYYGILKLGAIVVPLSPDTKQDSLTPILDVLEPKLIIADRKMSKMFSRMELQSKGIEKILLLGKTAETDICLNIDVFNWFSISGNPIYQTTDVESRLNSDDLASIIFTSGSTGKPKGVMLTHRNIVANTRSIVRYLQLSQEDIQMVVLPFFYVMGKSLLNTHFAIGGMVVINNQFMYPASVINQMIEEKVTGFSGVPSTFSHMLHKSPLADYRDKLGSLRYCSQAGGHMARSAKEELMSVLPEETKLYVMYGATEAAARLSYVEPEMLSEKIESIGKPISGVKLKIIGEDGAELPCGEIGEIVAEGDNISPGYWRDKESTKKAFSIHGYHTGDLGYRDKDGYFFCVGRKDHQVKVGGHRINPVEIEDVIFATGLVVEVSVVALPDVLLGSRLIAVTVSGNVTVDVNQLLSACNEKLPKFKVPQDVLFVGNLPKNANGKVDKRLCEQLCREHYAMNEAKADAN